MNTFKNLLVYTILISIIFTSCDVDKCDEYQPPKLIVESTNVYLHSEDNKTGFIVETEISNSNGGCTEIADGINLIMSPFYKASKDEEWNGINLNVIDGGYGSGSTQTSEILLQQIYNPEGYPMADMAVIPISRMSSGVAIVRKEFFQPNIPGFFKIKYELLYNVENESTESVNFFSDSVYVGLENCVEYSRPDFNVFSYLTKMESTSSNGLNYRCYINNVNGFCAESTNESQFGFKVFYQGNGNGSWEPIAINKLNENSYEILETKDDMMGKMTVKSLAPGEWEDFEILFITDISGKYKIQYFLDAEGDVDETDEENNVGESNEFFL